MSTQVYGRRQMEIMDSRMIQ